MRRTRACRCFRTRIPAILGLRQYIHRVTNTNTTRERRRRLVLVTNPHHSTPHPLKRMDDSTKQCLRKYYVHVLYGNGARHATRCALPLHCPAANHWTALSALARTLGTLQALWREGLKSLHPGPAAGDAYSLAADATHACRLCLTLLSWRRLAIYRPGQSASSIWDHKKGNAGRRLQKYPTPFAT